MSKIRAHCRYAWVEVCSVTKRGNKRRAKMLGQAKKEMTWKSGRNQKKNACRAPGAKNEGGAAERNESRRKSRGGLE